jgi:hypothetical protein
MESQFSVQEEMFKALLRTPHRQVDETLHLHKSQFERDPNFYGKLAAYCVIGENCAVRDINEVFIATLLVSSYEQHQEAGYVMFQSLPPYEADRVANYVTGYDETIVRHSYESDMPKQNSFGVTYEIAKYGSNHPDPEKRGKDMPVRVIKLGNKSKLRALLIKQNKIDYNTKEITATTYLVHHKCYNQRNFKGILKRAVKSYLKYRENNPAMMEGALIRSAQSIKKFYVRTHALPLGNANSWINRYLFADETIPGTRLHALKTLQNEKDPIRQAEIVTENNLPFTVVSSLMSDITPSVTAASIMVMSYQEIMQSMDLLKRRGAFDNPDLKKLIHDKLEKAKKAKKGRMDAMKGKKAASTKGLDKDTQSLLKDITDQQLKHHSNISVPTALLIDKSGSMTESINLGKQLSAAIAQACAPGNEPIVYLFDATPVEIEWNKKDGDITLLSSWEKKLAMFRANGGTDPAAVLMAMELKNQVADQILLVTDEGENNEGKFAKQLKSYSKKMGVTPNIVIVRIGSSGYGIHDIIEKSLKKAGFNVTVLVATGIDSVSLPNVIQLLSCKSTFELVQEILSLTLPTRSEWDANNLLNVVSEGVQSV